MAHAGQEVRSQPSCFQRNVAHLIARAIGLFLGALAVGDIHQHPLVVFDLARRVVNGARTLLARDDAAVAPAYPHFEVLDHSLSFDDSLEPGALLGVQP